MSDWWREFSRAAVQILAVCVLFVTFCVLYIAALVHFRWIAIVVVVGVLVIVFVTAGATFAANQKFGPKDTPTP